MLAQPTRTAVYGPVRTVVWQGSAGDRRPYADLTGKFSPGGGALRRKQPKNKKTKFLLFLFRSTFQVSPPFKTPKTTKTQKKPKTQNQRGPVRGAVNQAASPFRYRRFFPREGGRFEGGGPGR